MKVLEKGSDEPVHMPWDAAQAALASGAYEPHVVEGERGPDLPATQSPAPGTDPAGGKEQETEGNQPSNMVETVKVEVSGGLPKEPDVVRETVQQPVKVTPSAAPAPKVDEKKADK